uniref:Uncharacterized protein n=1 Tax=uncultured Desulfobacterium sp. TaxID=201089 RepID=E1YG96_9BACT|nr:unknown protein [uncultured Desulfobacterium sp.]
MPGNKYRLKFSIALDGIYAKISLSKSRFMIFIRGLFQHIIEIYL